MAALAGAHAQPAPPPGMVPYDHPVYHNGKLVLWHGIGHGDDKDAADKGASDKPAAEPSDAAADATADDKPAEAASEKVTPKLKAEARATVKPTEAPVAVKPSLDFALVVDADDACAMHMGADVFAATKANLRLHIVTGRVSSHTLARLANGNSADFAIAPLDALLTGDPAPWREKSPYIIRLGNEPIEIIAVKAVTKPADLTGRLVAVGLPDGAAEAVTTALFARLGVKPRPIGDNLADGLKELARGRIDAVVAVGAGGVKALADFGMGDRFHVVALPMTAELRSHYSPARILATDQPKLIGDGANVDTLATPMALIAINAGADSARATRDSAFVNTLFDGFSSLAAPGADPTWRDVNLAATLDWPRLPAAQDWLSGHAGGADPGFAAFRDLARNGEAPDADRLFQSLMQARGDKP